MYDWSAKSRIKLHVGAGLSESVHFSACLKKKKQKKKKKTQKKNNVFACDGSYGIKKSAERYVLVNQ